MFERMSRSGNVIGIIYVDKCPVVGNPFSVHVSDALYHRNVIVRLTSKQRLSCSRCNGRSGGRNGWGEVYDDDPEVTDGSLEQFCARRAGDDDEIDVEDGKGEDRRVWCGR